MDWPEIKRRLTKEGTSVQILADLAGVPYKTMYNRIKWHEKQDGVKYLNPTNTKVENRKRKPAAKKAGKLPEDVPKLSESEKAAGEVAEVMAFMEAVPDGIKVEIRRDCPDAVPKLPEVFNAGYKIQPETIDELNRMYFQCKQLAEKYQKQAEDWRRIMETCASWENAKEGAKLPEGQ